MPEAVWAYRTTWKTTIGFTPYELVYGKKEILLIEYEYQTLRIIVQLGIDLSTSYSKRDNTTSMHLIKLGWRQYTTPMLFKIKESDGVTSSSKPRKLVWVIGIYSMTQDINTTRESYKKGGLVPMKSSKCFPMDPYSYIKLMRLGSPYRLIDIG